MLKCGLVADDVTTNWPLSGVDPRFAKGADHGERVECEPITRHWVEPQRGPGAEPLLGVPWSWKLLVYFHTEGAKSLVFKLKKTPIFGPRGRPPGAPYLGSASDRDDVKYANTVDILQ